VQRWTPQAPIAQLWLERKTVNLEVASSILAGCAFCLTWLCIGSRQLQNATAAGASAAYLNFAEQNRDSACRLQHQPCVAAPACGGIAGPDSIDCAHDRHLVNWPWHAGACRAWPSQLWATRVWPDVSALQRLAANRWRQTKSHSHAGMRQTKTLKRLPYHGLRQRFGGCNEEAGLF
jgi:hypothetical protein